MSTTSLKLPDELKESIQRFAAEDGLSPHAFMVRTLEHAVRRAETRRSFIAEGEASLDEVQSGGTVYAAKDVHDWMRASLRGKAAAAPKPVNPPRRRA